MRIVADENIPFLDAFFGSLAEVSHIERCPGRTLSPGQLRDADVLLVRSVTAVDESLLAGTPVRFLGTATIGTDHVDSAWLNLQGIPFAAAPGCNAEAVGDYVLSTLARMAGQDSRPLSSYSVGIVGAGNVGGRLWQRLTALGLDVLASDPPRQEAGDTGFSDLDAVLAQDVICLHTPLTTNGSHPTFHLLNAERLAALSAHQTLINAGRGAVVDNNALSRRLEWENPPRVVLDVWENEPAVDGRLAARLWQATPHIAGYSLEGKARGTAMLYEAFCQHFGITPTVSLERVLPPPQPIHLPEEGSSAEGVLMDAMLRSYDPIGDHDRFMATRHGTMDEQALAFDQLRKDYPVRREFSSQTITGISGERSRRLLRAAGVGVV